MADSLEILGAEKVTVNTPHGAIEISASMTPVQWRRAMRLLVSYRESLEADVEPDWDAIFELAAELTGFDVAAVRSWGHIDAVRIVDFFVKRWGVLMERMTPKPSTSSPPASKSPSRSRARSRSAS